MQIDIDNQSDFLLSTPLLEQLESLFAYVLESLNLRQKQCELLLVNNDKIAELNAEFRSINAPTDVLSFPLESDFSPFLGSVVISLDYAKEIAQKLNHSVENEIALLFIHGILHLVGFDHEVDCGEQRAMESQIVEHFKLPKSLIIRQEEC